MLHAIANNKATAFVNRLSTEESIRQPLEDMITSTVFGPLDLMSDELAAQGLSQILGPKVRAFQLRSATLSFWPRQELGTTQYRQSDVEAQCQRGGAQPIQLRIEVKWGRSPDPNQLLAPPYFQCLCTG